MVGCRGWVVGSARAPPASARHIAPPSFSPPHRLTHTHTVPQHSAPVAADLLQRRPPLCDPAALYEARGRVRHEEDAYEQRDGRPQGPAFGWLCFHVCVCCVANGRVNRGAGGDRRRSLCFSTTPPLHHLPRPPHTTPPLHHHHNNRNNNHNNRNNNAHTLTTRACTATPPHRTPSQTHTTGAPRTAAPSPCRPTRCTPACRARPPRPPRRFPSRWPAT